MSDDTAPPGGALSRERLIPGMTEWVKVYSFFYDGEVYEYAYEVGSTSHTMQQAEDISLRNAFALRAQLNFLRDVLLRIAH